MSRPDSNTGPDAIDIAPFPMVGAPLVRPIAISLGVGALVGGCVAALMALGRRGRTVDVTEHVPAALAQAIDRENVAQVRDAGRDSIRDGKLADWDQTDETSDESFPASDPPAGF